MWDSFYSIFRKEFVHIRRDRGTLMLGLALPVFQLVLFGFIDQTVRDLPTVVVDQDRSVSSREVMDRMRASRTFAVERVTTSTQEARDEVIAGRARVAVVIPPDFHRKRVAHRPAQMLVFIDQTVRDLPTVVVDQDRSVSSREVMDRMRASRTFAIERVTTSTQEARDEVVAGRARVAVVIPPDFHRKRVAHRPAQMLVFIDGSDSNASSQALGSINGLSAQMSLEASGAPAGQAPPVAAQPIILFNPEGRTANFIIPGLIAILLQLVGLLFTAMAIVREREKGTMEQLLVTPIQPLGLMLGKLAPYLVLSLGEMAIVLALMRFGFAVPIRGSIVFLFVMATIYLFAILSMGLFISTRASTVSESQQMAQMTLLPSIFLSGYIFPQAGLPYPLYVLGLFLPATHMISIMRGVVLRNAGPMDLLPNVLALLAISVILVWASARRLKKVTG